MITYLVVTDDMAGAMHDIKQRDKITPTGKDRGFLPNGRNVLFLSTDIAEAAAGGLELSGYEFIRVSGDTTALAAVLDAQLLA